jgi:hypothetical protein
LIFFDQFEPEELGYGQLRLNDTISSAWPSAELAAAGRLMASKNAHTCHGKGSTWLHPLQQWGDEVEQQSPSWYATETSTDIQDTLEDEGKVKKR